MRDFLNSLGMSKKYRTVRVIGSSFNDKKLSSNNFKIENSDNFQLIIQYGGQKIIKSFVRHNDNIDNINQMLSYLVSLDPDYARSFSGKKIKDTISKELDLSCINDNLPISKDFFQEIDQRHKQNISSNNGDFLYYSAYSYLEEQKEKERKAIEEERLLAKKQAIKHIRKLSKSDRYIVRIFNIDFEYRQEVFNLLNKFLNLEGSADDFDFEQALSLTLANRTAKTLYIRLRTIGCLCSIYPVKRYLKKISKKELELIQQPSSKLTRIPSFNLDFTIKKNYIKPLHLYRNTFR